MRNRNYIGGVGKATPFLKSDNSGDYTTEDMVVALKGNKVTIPKGTYIGVGALNEDFVKIKGIIAQNIENPSKHYMTAQDVLHSLRAEYTSWYKDNESKDNYGYTDPKTFIKDTSRRNPTQEGIDNYLESLYPDQRYTLYGGNTDYHAKYTIFPKTPRKIEPKKATSIEINEDEPKLQKATMPEFPDAGPSKADLFFQGLETAKVYENRPDEFSDDAAKNVKGKKTVKTQYIFSDENPFKPKGKYFMSSANTKGKRKKDGNLNKAREWERKNGLGVQKDIAGYIPNLEFGG